MSEPMRPDYDYRPRRHAARGPAWPILALAAVLIAAIGLGIGLVVAGLLDDSPTAADGSPSPSAGVSAAASADEPDDTPAPAPSSGTTTSEVQPGAVVAAIADAIALREGASVDATRLGRLANGSHSFVVDGPVPADGFDWFQLTGMGIPPQSGCVGPIETDPYTCPIWFGWAAGGSGPDDPWLEAVQIECPAPGPLDERWVQVQMEPMSLLACFGSPSVTVIGWLPEILGDGLGGACPQYATESAFLCDLGYTKLTISEEEDWTGRGLSVAVPPDGADEFEGLRGQWLEVTGHFDDPAAQGCPEGHDRQRCRARFVVEFAIPTEAP